MNLLKFFLLPFLVVISSGVFSQTMNDGLQAFYNRNYNKALDIFLQAVQGDPNNPETHYWLGQAYINLEEADQAEDVYHQAFTNKKMKNAALLIAGVGHVLLAKGDSAEARAKFEEALIQSRNRNAIVMTAIGYANLHPNGGNLDYAIEVLTRATTTKRFEDSRVYVYLGYAYKRKFDGSNAVKNFNRATAMNAKEAEAYYQVGKIFATQNNVSVFLKNYRMAVAADPNFSPVYLELYSHFFTQLKIDSAQYYLNLYESHIEQTSESKALISLFASEILFLKKDYDLSISRLNSIQADKATRIGKIIASRKNRVLALNYETKGEYASSFKYITDYIEQEKNEEGACVSDMYIYSRIIAACRNMRDEHFVPVAKQALSIVNEEDKKMSILRKMIEFADKEKYARGSADLKVLMLSMKQDPLSNDYFNAGYACFGAKMYDKAQKYLSAYVDKEPDQPFGHFWLGQTSLALDNTMESSKPHYDKYILLAEADVESNKSGLKTAYTFMGGYYTKAKEFPKAIGWWDKLLSIDPENKIAKKTKGQLVIYLKKMADYEKRKAEYERRKKEMEQ